MEEVLNQFNSLDYTSYEDMYFEPQDFYHYIDGMLEDFDYPELPYFKWVLKTEQEGVYRSWYDKKFEYKLGEVAIPKMGSYNSGIHCSKDFEACYDGGRDNKEDRIMISLSPVNQNEEAKRFPSGVKVEKEITNVQELEDWVEWLYNEKYIDENLYKRMKIYYYDGKVYSGKCVKEYKEKIDEPKTYDINLF